MARRRLRAPVLPLICRRGVPAEKLGRLSFAECAASCGKGGGCAAVIAVARGVGMCGECFRAHLFGKFKVVVTSNAMVRPTDSVPPRLLRRPRLQMRSKAIQSWDASNSQALPVFGVGVAFVHESVLSSNPKPEIELAIEDIKSIVLSLSPGDKAIHITPIEDLFYVESKDREGSLRELVGMIDDDTGREDFLQCLRMLSLQKILPSGTNLHEHVFSLLPKFWTERVDTASASQAERADTASASHSSLRREIK